LKGEDPNADDDPRDENRPEEICGNGGRVVGEVPAKPPTEEGEPRKEETQNEEPCANLVHNFYINLVISIAKCRAKSRYKKWEFLEGSH
jgi:hypothetical protein